MMVVAPLPGGIHRLVATTAEAPRTPDRDFLQKLLDARGPEARHPLAKRIGGIALEAGTAGAGILRRQLVRSRAHGHEQVPVGAGHVGTAAVVLVQLPGPRRRRVTRCRC